MKRFEKQIRSRYELNKTKKRDFSFTAMVSIKKPTDNTERKNTNIIKTVKTKSRFSNINEEDSDSFVPINYNTLSSPYSDIWHNIIHSPSYIINLNMCNMLMGDEKSASLVTLLDKTPIATLNITNNNITNKSMFIFGKILKKLITLKVIILSNNLFTDEGVSYILSSHNYSSSITTLDLSYNKIGLKSAYLLGKVSMYIILCVYYLLCVLYIITYCYYALLQYIVSTY